MDFLSMDPVTKELTLNSCDIPKPKGNEVLIRVAYSGICGSDLHILDVRLNFSVETLKNYNCY